MKASVFLSSLVAGPVALAVQPPAIQGMSLTWHDSFKGDAGSSARTGEWNYITQMNVNNELQDYTESNSNVQLSGGETLQIVPWRDDSGLWTSGRLEAKESFTPQAGKLMRWQAGIRMGEGADRQGMWPAFWLLGDSIRHGTNWPLCGELDIMERVNNDMEGFGTVHCGTESGGICNEPEGLGKAVSVPNNHFHQWSLQVDRTSGNWQTETIQWMMDGTPYHTLTGADIGDEGTWSTLAHSPFYMILNVAVGGTWPGDPTSSTQDGWDSMMEVQYVAVYEN